MSTLLACCSGGGSISVLKVIVCLWVYPIAGLEHWTGLLDSAVRMHVTFLWLYSTGACICLLLCVLAGLCQIEVLGSNKHVGLAKEKGENGESKSRSVFNTSGLISLCT